MTAGKGAAHTLALVAVTLALEITPVTRCSAETPCNLFLKRRLGVSFRTGLERRSAFSDDWVIALSRLSDKDN